MKKKSKVLILGGSGFVGKNIIEQLSNKYSLIYPTHRELDLLKQESVTKYFSKKKIDTVIYSVNIGGTRNNISPIMMLHDNLTMFFNIVKNKKKFRKMIFLGSGAIYDKSEEIKNIKEENFGKSIPIDDYGLYKYICSEYISSSDNNFISLELFGLFGKYEDYEIRFISNAICKSIFDMQITINQNVYFDYVFIEDFIKIIDYFIENTAKYKLYNVGSGQKIDLISLSKHINYISKKRNEIKILKKGLGKEYTCNNSRLKKEIPNLSFMNTEDTIKKLYTYYEKNKMLINKKSLTVNYP